MSKFRKLAVTTVALMALAVGGAAFAQAQNAASVTTTPTHQSLGDGDGEHADGPDASAAVDGEHADGPESAVPADHADGQQQNAGDESDGETQD